MTECPGKRQQYRDVRVHTPTTDAQRKKDREEDSRDTRDVRIHTTETQRGKGYQQTQGCTYAHNRDTEKKDSD